MQAVKAQKLANHPVRISRDPERDGQVMDELRKQLAGTVSNHYGHDQGREDHDDAQRFPDHAPANIFQQPKNDVKIFHFTVLKRDAVFCHVPKIVRFGTG